MLYVVYNYIFYFRGNTNQKDTRNVDAYKTLQGSRDYFCI